MKTILSILLCFGFVFCKGQKDTPLLLHFGKDTSTIRKFIYTPKSTLDTTTSIYMGKSPLINYAPSFPERDTVKCWFYEVLDSNSDIFKWTSGYVVRRKGFIDFEAFSGFPTRVQPSWLPITSGIITSPLFYSNMDSVKNKAIKIVLKQ